MDEAKKYLNPALKKNSKYVDSNIIMGYVAFAEKDYPLAIQYFKKALELYPGYFSSEAGLKELKNSVQ